MKPTTLPTHEELDEEDVPDPTPPPSRQETGFTTTIKTPLHTSGTTDDVESEEAMSDLEKKVPADDSEDSSVSVTDDEIADTDPTERAEGPAMVTGEIETISVPSHHSVINFRLKQIDIDVRKSFPDAPKFLGYEPGMLELLLFIQHLRQKMVWDEEMYPTAQDQIAYALSRLDVEERAYFAEYINEDGSIGLDSLDDFIRILRENHTDSRKAVRSLKRAIDFLQTKLEILEPRPVKKPKPKRREVRSGLRVDTWPAFKQLVEGKPPTALQALAGKPKFSWQKSTDETKPFSVDSEAQVPLEIWEEKWKSGHEVPERIRINSPDLLKALRDVSKEEWAGPEVPDYGLENPSVVFLRPYKFFWYYQDHINKKREELEKAIHDLEQRHTATESHENKSVETKALSYEKKTQEELHQTRKLLEDMNCLIRFIKAAVTPVAFKYQDKENVAQKITFGDLWYLFRPGEVAVSRGSTEEDAHASNREDDRSASQPAAWRIFDVAGGRPRLGDGRSEDAYMRRTFKIQCYRIDYNGSTMGPAVHCFSILYFEGEREINSLRLVPLRCAKHQEKLQQRFENNGRKFLSVNKPAFCYQMYSGKKYTCCSDGAESGPAVEGLSLTSKRIQGPIIVDVATAVKEDPEWTSYLAIHSPLAADWVEFIEDWPFRVWKVEKQENEPTISPDDEKADRQTYYSLALEEHIYNDSHIDRSISRKVVSDDPFLKEFRMGSDDEPITVEDFEQRFFMENKLLLADKVCAYILDRMCFAILAVEGLQDPIQDSRGWNDLLLEPSHQTVIKALVRNHRMKHEQGAARMNRTSHDLVDGKGEGLIILLHGAPGLGKTSTVECLRDELQVPLLALSCGNLGNHAKDIEENLEQLFYTAQLWNCMILLDEADVVLAERGRDQFKENEVCSVFLRKLEYYQGVLFLTTNRVGHIDEAIKSRIHLAIHYPNLSEDVMEELLRNTLGRLKSSPEYKSRLDVNIRDIVRHCMKFIREKMSLKSVNGRVIRNISQVAVALAEEEALEESTLRPLRLRWRHFEQALEFHANFESYLQTTRGNDSKRAFELTLRSDEWSIVKKDKKENEET